MRIAEPLTEQSSPKYCAAQLEWLKRLVGSLEEERPAVTRPRTPAPAAQCVVLSLHNVAGMFGKGETWFSKHKPELEAAGFPSHDPLLDGWNLYRVIAWFEGRTETAPVRDDGIQDRLEAMRNGQG